MRSVRLSRLAAVIVVVSHGSGCGSSEVYLPTGTAAMLQDRDAPRVLARVPIEQRANVKRRSLTLMNTTPVTILDDPAKPERSLSSSSSQTPNDPVGVKVANGTYQGIEVRVRRRDLTLPSGPNENLAAFLPISFLILIATAAVLWSIEALVLALKSRRKGTRDEITIDADARFGSHTLTPRRTNRITDRGDRECDQWLAWVAAMTARRKLRCMDSCRRFTVTSH